MVHIKKIKKKKEGEREKALKKKKKSCGRENLKILSLQKILPFFSCHFHPLCSGVPYVCLELRFRVPSSGWTEHGLPWRPGSLAPSQAIRGIALMSEHSVPGPCCTPIYLAVWFGVNHQVSSST